MRRPQSPEANTQHSGCLCAQMQAHLEPWRKGAREGGNPVPLSIRASQCRLWEWHPRHTKRKAWAIYYELTTSDTKSETGKRSREHQEPSGEQSPRTQSLQGEDSQGLALLHVKCGHINQPHL